MAEQQSPQLQQIGNIQARPTGVVNRQNDSGQSTPDPVQGGTFSTPNTTSYDMLKNIFGQGSKLANKMMETEAEKVYLQGQAAAQSGRAREDIDSNPLTQNWADAGYNDTQARMDLAQQDADIFNDMDKLKEQSPEEFNQELQRRRSKVMDNLPSMSSRGRKQMGQQLDSSNRMHIRRQSQEHAKHIVQQKAQSINSTLSSKTDAMDNARDNGDPSYKDMVPDYVNSLKSMTEDLPDEERARIRFQGIKAAMDRGHAGVFSQAKDFDDDEGKDGDQIVRNLPLGQQNKLGEMQRKMLEDDSEEDVTGILEELAEEKASWGTDKESDMSFPEWRDLNKRALDSDAIGKGAYSSNLQKFIENRDKVDKKSASARAWLNDDANKLDELGVSRSQAAKNYVQKFAKDNSRLDTVKMAGRFVQNDKPEAMEAIGSTIKNTMGRIRNTDDPSSDDISTMTYLMNSIEEAERDGNKEAKQRLLAGMPSDDDRDILEGYMEYRKSPRTGGDISKAIDMAYEHQQEYAGLSASEKRARRTVTDSEIEESLGELDSGPMRSVAYGIRNLFNQKGDVDKLRRSFFGSPAKDHQNNVVKRHLREEMKHRASFHPDMPLDQVKEHSMSAMASRTLSTKSGPVVLPRGSSIDSFFEDSGLPKSDRDGDRIGKAIDRLAKPLKEDADEVSFSVSSSGDIRATRWQGDERTTDKIIPKDDIVRELDTMRKEETSHNSQRYVPERSKVNPKIAYSGENSSRFNRDEALQLRDDLIEHEGVKDTVYKDSEGVLTVGAGVSEKSDFWPDGLKEGDKVNMEDMSRMFSKASNQAMNLADKAQDHSGAKGDKWRRLFGSMAYQSGDLTKQDAFNSLMDAVNSGDYQRAYDKMQDTNAYKYAGSSRKKFYMDLFKEAMNR